MKLAIMQPYFVPYIGYWQLLDAADRFVVYDDVNYIKGGWINRNRVLINGQPSYLTLPLKGASPNVAIDAVELQLTPRWVDKTMKTIANTYRRAPYFASTEALIADILATDTLSLSAFLVRHLRCVANFLGIDTEIVPSSRVYGNNSLKGAQRVLDICRREGCTTYINPIGGQALYDFGAFAEDNVELCFIKTRDIRYRQTPGCEFQPNLSIVDVLMFNGAEGTRALLGEFDLVRDRDPGLT